MLDEEELEDPVVDVVLLEEFEGPVVVVDEVAPVVPVVVELAVPVVVVDVVPLVDDVVPSVPALVAVVDVVPLLVVVELVFDSVAGSDEQATNEAPMVHVTSKSEARLSFLIVFGPEAARVTLFGNRAPG